MNKKAYIVYESWGICDDCSIIGCFLDKESCKKFVEEKMIPRNKELEQMKICEKCRCHDKEDFDYTHKYDEIFLLEDDCPIAKIGVDRNGKYCDNEKSDYYSLTTNSIWYTEVDIIG